MNYKLSLQFCVISVIAIASLIAIFTTLGKNGAISVLFAISFIIVFVCYLSNIDSIRNNTTVFLLMILCFFNITTDALLENGHFSFNYYKKMLMFLGFCILLNIIASDKIFLSTRARQTIESLPVLAGLFLIVSYYYLGNTDVMAEGITLGFSNPNFAGMWLLHFFLYDCIFILKVFSGGSKWRLLVLPIAVITFMLIDATKTRSCLVGVFFFFVFIVIGLFKNRVDTIMILGVLLFPIIYAIVYLKTVNTNWFQETFSFMISEGKTLFSRVRIWEYALSAFEQHPIFGSYSGISDGSGASQLHNTHVDVLTSYGIIPFAIFVKLLNDDMVQVFNNKLSFYRYMCFCAFASIVVMGSFEAAVVAGSMGLNLLTVGLVALAQAEEKND